MVKQKITLSVESKVYSNFKKYCEENGIMLSKIIELDMKKRMEEKKQKYE